MKKFFISLFVFIILITVLIACFYKPDKTVNTVSNQKINTCDKSNYSKEYVSFNKKSLIYHDLNCECVSHCTINCEVMEREKAIQLGGKPCKWCHGGE